MPDGSRLKCLTEAALRHDPAVHDCVLTTDHVHLLATPGAFPWSSYACHARDRSRPEPKVGAKRREAPV
jgi:hypothetical protein